MIAARIGERLYEFNSFAELTKAREIYAKFVGTQNDFETEMENQMIDFTVDISC